MLSKTLKVNAKKTKSGLKNPYRNYLVVVCMGVIYALVAWIIYDTNRVLPSESVVQKVCEGEQVGIGNLCFKPEYADTNSKRLTGLSNRDNLPKDTAMVFVFEGSMRQCMWMKDMKIPIDIIWLDQQQKILKIEHAVKPETYPTNFCQENTKYVIEINAGLAQSLGLAIGDSVQL